MCRAAAQPVESTSCDVSGVANVAIVLSDMDDSARISGFVIPQTINGALGDDIILVDSSLTDTRFNAGPGRDSVVVVGDSNHFDLVSATPVHFSDIEVIDIRGDGPNELTLSPSAIRAISDDAQTIVLRHDADDTVHYHGNWIIDTPIFIDGETIHVAREGDAELRIANTLPWHNPLNGLDSNRDNFVSPMDMLLIINTINANGARLFAPANTQELPPTYFDTNGDQFVTPMDILLVINFLNSQRRGVVAAEAEGNESRPRRVSDNSARVPAIRSLRIFTSRLICHRILRA